MFWLVAFAVSSVPTTRFSPLVTKMPPASPPAPMVVTLSLPAVGLPVPAPGVPKDTSTLALAPSALSFAAWLTVMLPTVALSPAVPLVSVALPTLSASTAGNRISPEALNVIVPEVDALKVGNDDAHQWHRGR